MEKYLYWSFHTGQFYDVLRDEVDTLDAFQLRMLKKPSGSCKKCFGRFYVGKNVNTELYVPCSKCAKNCVDFETLNPEGENVIDLDSDEN